MQNATFTYNDATIHYTISGQGDPIIFIHGFTLDRQMWKPQMDFFKTTHRVISYDARGYGRSSLPNKKYSHVDDLNALLKHLNINKVHLVGLSMGGRISINFALTYPEKVRSLTLMDTAIDGHTSTIDWNVHAGDAGVAAAKQNWLNHPIFAFTKTNKYAIKLLKPIINNYSGWHWLNVDAYGAPSTDAFRRLNEITVPTLVMVGEKDLDYFQDIARVIADKIPSSRHAVIKDAGHMINIESPALVNNLVAEFIVHSL